MGHNLKYCTIENRSLFSTNMERLSAANLKMFRSSWDAASTPHDEREDTGAVAYISPLPSSQSVTAMRALTAAATASQLRSVVADSAFFDAESLRRCELWRLRRR